MARNGDTVEHHKGQGQCGVREKRVGTLPTSLECLTTSMSLEPQLGGQIMTSGKPCTALPLQFVDDEPQLYA